MNEKWKWRSAHELMSIVLKRLTRNSMSQIMRGHTSDRYAHVDASIACD